MSDRIENKRQYIDNKDHLNSVMKNLEKRVNPYDSKEGVNKLLDAIIENHESILVTSMSNGAKEFTEKVGRPMTYSETRAMWG
jgi:hypothetical protein